MDLNNKPVASWTTILLILVFSLIYGWKTKQIDFDLAYTQADVECELYIEISNGFEVVGEHSDYVLKLKKNLFGQKQAGRVLNKHLVNKLESVGLSRVSLMNAFSIKAVLCSYCTLMILYWWDPTIMNLRYSSRICRKLN
jgi:Reverse transcriptase (RNA-dependent DNA polymerase)